MQDDTRATNAPDGPQASGARSEEKSYWLDAPRNVRKIYLGLWVVCLLLLAADLLYHKHAEVPIEELFGFFAFFGFLSYVFIVFSAKQLRKIVKRDEDHYD